MMKLISTMLSPITRIFKMVDNITAIGEDWTDMVRVEQESRTAVLRESAKERGQQSGELRKAEKATEFSKLPQPKKS